MKGDVDGGKYAGRPPSRYRKAAMESRDKARKRLTDYETNGVEVLAGRICSSRFGVLAPDLAMTPVTAAETIVSATWAGVRKGSWVSRSTAAPATWGAAIEVPLADAVAVVDVCQAELIPTPGAYKSTQLP